MKSVTVTREDFRNKIVANKDGFGIVRMLRHDDDADCNPHFRLSMELAMLTVIADIELELFGAEDEEEGD